MRFKYIILFISLSLVSCRQETPENQNNYEYSGTGLKEKEDLRQIFYSMNLPDEMSRLFERAGANFNPSFINPPENYARYNTPVKAALNMGIYGVDMSYARISGQILVSTEYLGTIQLMASKLDIPAEIYDTLLLDLNNYMNNPDSLAFLAGKIYESTDTWLKGHGHKAEAALIITGGWIESLYIATRIFQENPANMEIMDRIAEQKYSLNSLISLLSNYRDDLEITEYLLMLKALRKAYADFEIYYKELEVDTANKLISTPGYETEISPSLIIEISMLTGEIRSRIVD